MANYTDQAAVEALLGRDLTVAEAAEFDAVNEAVTEWIEAHTSKSWQSTTYTAEQYTIRGTGVTLRHAPVVSISSIQTRPNYVGATWLALSSGSGYELVDAARGHLLVNVREGWLLSVTYSVVATPPKRVSLAASKLVVLWLAPTGNVAHAANVAAGIKSYSSGGDISVTYADAASRPAVPDDILSLLRFKGGSLFA